MDIEVIIHYCKNADAQCTGDYSAVTVNIDGKLCAYYGDYYHDKGEERADGFVDGMRYLNPDANVTYNKVADWDF